MNYSTRPGACRPGKRCKQWRVCDACAKIRQAQIADVAAAGAAQVPRITYAVARTYDASSINRDRQGFIARLAKISEGGLWTIETGVKKGGLHINVIAGTLDGLAAAELAACWPGGSADFWAADVPRQDARKIAAYISKRAAIPDTDCYSGRLYGSWGTWRRPLAALAEDKTTPPVLAGAAIQTMLEAAVSVTPVINKHATDRERYLKTLYAAHKGELLLHGVCYIPGHGVATLADARKIGAI